MCVSKWGGVVWLPLHRGCGVNEKRLNELVVEFRRSLESEGIKDFFLLVGDGEKVGGFSSSAKLEETADFVKGYFMARMGELAYMEGMLEKGEDH
jgi:hypothetical protein